MLRRQDRLTAKHDAPTDETFGARRPRRKKSLQVNAKRTPPNANGRAKRRSRQLLP
jgi:hypothetical protein